MRPLICDISTFETYEEEMVSGYYSTKIFTDGCRVIPAIEYCGHMV